METRSAGIFPAFTTQRGASMLEFTIAAPVLLTAILGFFDIIQWLSVKQMLDEATIRAAEYAATVPNLDTDPTGLNPQGYVFQRYALARQKSSGAGVDSLHKTFLLGVPNQTTGSAGSTYEAVYVEDRNTGDPVELRSAVMVLLPGDCATFPDLEQVVCNRDGMGIPANGNRPAGTPARLLENHSIETVGFARTRGFLPYIGSRLIRSIQFVERQPIPPAPFGAHEDPLLSTGGQATPYPTPPPALPAPALPTPTPMSCVIDALKCTREATQDTDNVYCPRNSPTTTCTCTADSELCFN